MISTVNTDTSRHFLFDSELALYQTTVYFSAFVWAKENKYLVLYSIPEIAMSPNSRKGSIIVFYFVHTTILTIQIVTSLTEANLVHIVHLKIWLMTF